MPLRFSTLYRKTKPPVEISLILGVGGGIPPARAQKPRRSARKLGGLNRAEISLSFFEFFSGGARKRKIVRENFCKVAAVALAEAGGGAGHCPSKKVRAKDIISPNCRFSQGKSRCLAARTAPLG